MHTFTLITCKCRPCQNLKIVRWKLEWPQKGVHPFARCDHVSIESRWQIVLQTCVANTNAVDVSLTLEIPKDLVWDLYCNSLEADRRIYFKVQVERCLVLEAGNAQLQMECCAFIAPKHIQTWLGTVCSFLLECFTFMSIYSTVTIDERVGCNAPSSDSLIIIKIVVLILRNASNRDSRNSSIPRKMAATILQNNATQDLATLCRDNTGGQWKWVSKKKLVLVWPWTFETWSQRFCTFETWSFWPWKFDFLH